MVLRMAVNLNVKDRGSGRIGRSLVTITSTLTTTVRLVPYRAEANQPCSRLFFQLFCRYLVLKAGQ